jgi:two-component system sensor histidine kinase UhpB
MQSKLRVLNVEDSARDSALLRHHLERAPYELTFARVETAAAMQAALAAQTWDVILCDYDMPQFNALAALALLKELTLDIPFIIISGTIGEELAVEAMLAGAHDYLMKGKLARLVPTIERELQEAKNRQARRQAEEALKTSESALRALFAAMSDVIFEFDAQGCCKKIAPTNPPNLYRPPATYLGQTLEDLFAPAEAAYFLAQIRHTLAAGQPQTVHYPLQYAEQEFWFEGSISPLGQDSVVWIARDITERRRSEEQLKAYSTQLRALTASLSSAREEEGIRIAREVHDELGSLLTGLRWELKYLDSVLPQAADPCQVPALTEKLTGMLQLTDRMTYTVRRIASELRPSLLDDFGLAEAIAWQAQEFQTRTGIQCHCQSTTGQRALNKHKTTALFRIFQESLTNILRHAQASLVEITLAEGIEDFVLTIRDNGRGITPEQQDGLHSLGLLGMRERAHLVGGQVAISGKPTLGTVVTVRVPATD